MTVFESKALKDYSRKDLLRVLDSVRGKKGLVIDSSITGSLSLIAEYSLLKDHGVEKIYQLADTIFETSCHSLIYLVRPTLANVQLISTQIKTHQKQNLNIDHTIYFLPRKSLICDNYLQEQGVYGDVTIGEFHLDIIPYDNDIISLDLDDSFKHLFLEGDISVLKLLSNALMKFQIIYGAFPKIIGKGDSANLLADMLESSRLAYLTSNGGTTMKESDFDSLFIIDRTVDLITPLKTQFTYEGQIDELFGIKSCFVELDSSVFTDNNGPGPGHSRPKKILLNETDAVFKDIRDQSFEVVGDILSKIAVVIKGEEESRNSLHTTGQLKEFASKLGAMQSRKQGLETHEKIYRRILMHASEPPTGRRWKLEEQIINRIIDVSFYDSLEELILLGTEWTIPLKLMCQYSMIYGGIKPKLYDQLIKDFCQAYGAHHIITFQNLEKLKLLESNDNQKSSFSHLSKRLSLLNDYESTTSNNTISYAYSGFAPISLRLLEAVTGNLINNDGKAPLSWKGLEDVTELIPGSTFEKSIIPDSKLFKSESTSCLIIEIDDGSPYTLVVFIGGCTMAEISALRTVSKNPDYKRRYVVLTTGITNGNKMLNSFVGDSFFKQ